jgi:hypothetical protein
VIVPAAAHPRFRFTLVVNVSIRTAAVNLMNRFVTDHSKRNLLDIVGALHSPRRLALRLNCRQKQTNQNANNRNDDKQFYKRKTAFINAAFHYHIFQLN